MVSESIEQYVLISMIAVIFTLAVIAAWTIVHYRKRKKWLELVSENSIKLRALHEYNQKWKFYEIKKEIVIEKTLSSETTFQEYNPDFLLNSAVMLQTTDFLKCLEKAENNREKYRQYCEGLDGLLSETPQSVVKTIHVPYSFFCQKEKNLCEKDQLRPQTDISVRIVLRYGKKRNEHVYTSGEVKKAILLLWKQKVKRTSEKLQALSRLNYTYSKEFIDISPDYHFSKFCMSLPDYRKYEYSDLFMRETIEDNYSMFSERIQQTKLNEEKYHNYLKEVKDLPPTREATIRTSEIPFKNYVVIEERLCQEQILQKPRTFFTCSVSVDYFSPKGRNHNTYEHSYSFDDILWLQSKVLDKWKKEREYKMTAEYERSRMTNSLRYNVMQRDGFRCVLCGATQEDGVKLHVDHIKPIAKGGKTEMSNLRTLCDRCNFGKRDKYDPYGLN